MNEIFTSNTPHRRTSARNNLRTMMIKVNRLNIHLFIRHENKSLFIAQMANGRGSAIKLNMKWNPKVFNAVVESS